MVVCVADVEQPPFVACKHHAPWCLADGLLRVCERKNEVKVSCIKDADILGQAKSTA